MHVAEGVLMLVFWLTVTFAVVPLWCVSRAHRSKGRKPPWQK